MIGNAPAQLEDRAQIAIALVKEVLGPRAGSRELLADNPRDEYITGVLKTSVTDRSTNLADLQADLRPYDPEALGSLNASADDAEENVPDEVMSPGSPTLDPSALPSSMGVSFVLKSEGDEWPLEFCATWGRYVPDGTQWRRVPEHYISGAVSAARSTSWDTGHGVRIVLRSRPLSEGHRSVSLYLINQIPLDGVHPADARLHVFQPEIRVNCGAGVSLVPVDIPGIKVASNDQGDLEDAALALQYRGKAALARGHLCGAHWREIDPQRPISGIAMPDEPPFKWTDGEEIPASDRDRFLLPDLRTDYTPCLPIESPTIEWDPRWGTAPVTSADELAELFEPAALESALRPLQEGYRHWIADCRRDAAGFPQVDRSAADFNLVQCDNACDRIGAAIDLLVTDANARLAFCFANKAISLQASWNGIADFKWHTFQLAFILLNIVGVCQPTSPDRDICDLLWFPTGGGKTEAYLGLSAFCLAFRRRQIGPQAASSKYRGGVSVISRYTLRLLSIQQFRRAAAMITACEYLRLLGLGGAEVGWHPQAFTAPAGFIWGTMRFSIGLWVGGAVTPNGMLSVTFRDEQNQLMHTLGALDILEGARAHYDGPNQRLRRDFAYGSILGEPGEPAQLLSCPACKGVLAIPDEGYDPGEYTINFVLEDAQPQLPSLTSLADPGQSFTVTNAVTTAHSNGHSCTLSIAFSVPVDQRLTPDSIDRWFNGTLLQHLGPHARLSSARPARPGYFILTYHTGQGTTRGCDFAIYCPNPECTLRNCRSAEQVPLSRSGSAAPQRSNARRSRWVTLGSVGDGLPQINGLHWQCVPRCFAANASLTIADRIPIPAYTVDDQVYHRIPSFLIATVDKFARLPFEPKASSLFGHVEFYHARWGYYRENCPPDSGNSLPTTARAHPPGGGTYQMHTGVSPFAAPDIIIQDELHLIEGPLGSLTGLFETAVDLLCTDQQLGQSRRPKYIASTATAKFARQQVQALFNRTLAQFPPSALNSDDRFFAVEHLAHPLDVSRPGRLYIAVCAPGKGMQTPNVRIWSALLQESYTRWLQAPTPESDSFYTLVGYFNAIRELASGLSLFRQDIPDWMRHRWNANARDIENSIELSSRKSSTELPTVLANLSAMAPDAPDAVLATSMFGTGVDVNRLGLMVMHGQPKSTAAYIQATGRVGRSFAGLVVTLLRPNRPRDLAHYEYFTAYHRALYRFVEPVTVAPFSSRARERAFGPLAVAILRNAQEVGGNPVDPRWRIEQRLANSLFFCHANIMASLRTSPHVQALISIFERRAQSQPDGRRPPANVAATEIASELDRWHAIAHRYRIGTDAFVYHEPAFARSPRRAVVLGDSYHARFGLDQVYENSPQTMRDVEETTGFRV